MTTLALGKIHLLLALPAVEDPSRSTTIRIRTQAGRLETEGAESVMIHMVTSMTDTTIAFTGLRSHRHTLENLCQDQILAATNMSAVVAE